MTDTEKRFDFLIDYNRGIYCESIWEYGLTHDELETRMRRKMVQGFTPVIRAAAKTRNQ